MKLAYELEDYVGLVKSAKSKLKQRSGSLQYDEAVALFAYYTKKAIDFFGIDSSWDIELMTDCTEEGACVNFIARYLHADISFNPEYFRNHPSEIIQAAVHEVAHIFLHKIHGFLQVLPEEYSEEYHPFNRYYVDAFEEMATRLERLFYKHTENKNGSKD